MDLTIAIRLLSASVICLAFLYARLLLDHLQLKARFGKRRVPRSLLDTKRRK